jgi:NADH-quinone oxidoreductase E subunit
MIKFSDESLKKIEELRKRYPTAKALTLPVLWMAQEQFGWISGETMQYVAGLLDLPVSHVYGVLTFYTMLNPRPVGKFHLQVCTNVSCMLRGSDRIVSRICERLKIKMGETTTDNLFTLTEVECLGSCGTAPMLQANDKFYENLTIEQIDRLIEEWK